MLEKGKIFKFNGEVYFEGQTLSRRMAVEPYSSHMLNIHKLLGFPFCRNFLIGLIHALSGKICKWKILLG